MKTPRLKIYQVVNEAAFSTIKRVHHGEIFNMVRQNPETNQKSYYIKLSPAQFKSVPVIFRKLLKQISTEEYDNLKTVPCSEYFLKPKRTNRPSRIKY